MPPFKFYLYSQYQYCSKEIEKCHKLNHCVIQFKIEKYVHIVICTQEKGVENNRSWTVSDSLV